MKKIFLIGMILIMSINLTACGKEEEVKFSIEKIGELTTLECYYHLVAEYEDDALPVLGLVSDIGYKKVWIECDGVAEYGIDVDDIKKEQKSHKIKVTIPKAKVHGIRIIVDSISDPIYDSGLFTSNASTENESEAMASAEKRLNDLANKNEDMMKQAQENAQETIERLFDQFKDEHGEEYEMEFVMEKE